MILEWVKNRYMTEFNSYISFFPKSCEKYNIWFDKDASYDMMGLKNNRFFSAAHTTHRKYACGKDHSFYNHSDDFIKIGDHQMPWRRTGDVKSYISIENYSIQNLNIE